MRKTSIILFLIYIGFGFTTVSGQIFTRIDHPLFLDKENATFGNGFIDYNNDGKLDIFICTSGKSKGRLFRNEGNDNFTKIIDDNLHPDIQYTTGITYGDYDNDGLNDLFLCSMGGNNSLIHNEGDGKFLRSNDIMWSRDGGFQVHCTFADYDNDGFIDLLIPASDGASFVKGSGHINYLYHNDGDGTFTKVATSAPEKVHGNNVCANFCDFDNDGDMDLFMTDCQVNNHLFENVNGTFTEIEAGVSENTNSSLACSWGDYDNDGFMDLFVANGFPAERGGYSNYLYHNNGNKTFTKVTTGPIAEYTGNSWHSLWADFDNDGDLDLFLGTFYYPDILFLNNGNGTFNQTTEFDSTTRGTSGASFGDYNNDGFLDLYSGYRMTTNNDQQLSGNTLYKNNGNNNKWLIISCIGTLSNRSAIGARVKVKANIFGKSYWQVREINGNMGLRSLNDLRAYFGLGDATIIDSLIIDWPSQQQTILTDVQVNQSLRIKESIPVNYIKPHFKANCFSGFSPLNVKFTNLSVYDESNSNISWSWDFDGDGKEDSNEKDPTFLYYNYDGCEYNVSLTISNGITTDTLLMNKFIKVLPSANQNIAKFQSAAASSCIDESKYPASYAVDGNTSTYWQSTLSDTQSIQIQLDSLYTLGKITLKWGRSYAKHFVIQFSEDGYNWTDFIEVDKSSMTTDAINVNNFKAKVIKLLLTQRAIDKQGFIINEIEIYRPASLTEVENYSNIPNTFKLNQNYPNPFNPVTTISYTIPSSSTSSPLEKVKTEAELVSIRVYDILGREVSTLVNEEQLPGTYKIQFDAGSLSSGIYFYKLRAGEYACVKKMMVLK